MFKQNTVKGVSEEWKYGDARLTRNAYWNANLDHVRISLRIIKYQ